MIQPLRTIHRNAFFCLAVFLPVLLVAGILKRHQSTEAGSNGARNPNGSLLTEQIVTLDGHRIAIDLYEVSREPVTMQFATSEPLVAPDVLIYWSEVGAKATLPSDSRFLGVFAPESKYALPLGGRARGYVILYSAARQALLGSFSYEGIR
jgi:hypothetical protein